MSRVTLMEECPSISETTLMLTSLESSRVAQVRLDWPYLVGVTWLAMLYFSRGRMGRAEGALLVALYVIYVVSHLAFG
jgi:Ca2+/Na+ antiporter